MCYDHHIKSHEILPDGIKIILDGNKRNQYGSFNPRTIAKEIKRRYEKSGGTKSISVTLLTAQIIGHAAGYVIGENISNKWLIKKNRTMDIEWSHIENR